MKRPAILILAAVNLALLAVLAWLWFTPAAELKNSTWEPPSARRADYTQMLPPLPSTAPVDTSKFVAMLDRPLFMLTRRPPPPPPPPEAAAPVDTLSTARIFGVFSSSAGGGVIMNIGGKDRRVRLNEAIDGGWTLQSVSGGTAIFVGGGQSRSLTMPRAALTAYTGMPASQPPPAPVPAPTLQPVPQPPVAATPSPESGAGGAQGSTAPRNTPDPRRATFGGSR
jgi:hypothetical protein